MTWTCLCRLFSSHPNPGPRRPYPRFLLLWGLVPLHPYIISILHIIIFINSSLTYLIFSHTPVVARPSRSAAGICCRRVTPDEDIEHVETLCDLVIKFCLVSSFWTLLDKVGDHLLDFKSDALTNFNIPARLYSSCLPFTRLI